MKTLSSEGKRSVVPPPLGGRVGNQGGKVFQPRRRIGTYITSSKTNVVSG